MGPQILDKSPIRPNKTSNISRWFLAVWFFAWLLVPAAIGDEQGNGITVGEPKVFDNRSLVSMVEQFEQSLSATGFVNKSDLAAALGNSQGSEIRDSSQTFQVSTLPTPQITTNSSATNGALSPTSQTTTMSSVNPQAPTPDTSNGSLPDAVTKKYGIAAADLLDQQVDLTYQIFNLKMLLERSLSDRDYGGKSRLQAVIGFQISLDPPQKYKGCAAVVEIRVLPESGTRPVSLVAMMPQEKTYNVATLTTHTNQFGAAAIVKVVQVGFSERRRGQTFFLVKDTDTYAFERDEKTEGAVKPLTFGWVFRPVLNRPSVDAGIRQVFAVIAPPVEDSSTSQASAQNMRVSVKTYWVPFDRKNATVKDSAKKGSDRSRADQSLALFTSPELQKDLSAKVNQLEWAEYGTDSALVKVSGDHFYSGTGAFVGGASLDKPSNGFYLRDDHYLQLVVPLRSLTLQDGEINGRYGVPAALLTPYIESQHWRAQPRWGFRMYETGWTPNPDRTSSTLRIAVFGKDGKSAPDLHGQKPLVSVGGQTFPPSLSNPLTNDSCPDFDGQGNEIPRTCLSFRIDVPSAIVAAEAPVDISVPFMGEDYHLHGFLYAPFRSVTATKIVDGEDVTVALSGTVFRAGVEVYADKLYTLGKDPELKVVAKDLIVLTLKKKIFDAVKNIAVISPSGTSHIVAVPSSKVDAPKETAPKPTVTGTPETAVNASQGISFAGKNLQSIKKVSFEGEELQFVAGKDGQSVTIYVTRKVTAKPGVVELLASTEDGTLVPLKLTIKGSPAATPPAGSGTKKSGSGG